jgi:hypothetical protein
MLKHMPKTSIEEVEEELENVEAAAADGGGRAAARHSRATREDSVLSR